MSTLLEPTDISELKRTWWLFLLLGIALIIVGFLAIGSPWIAGEAVVATLGILLVVGGVLEIVNAFGARRWGGFFLHLLLGILYLVVGERLWERPGRGLEVITLILAVAFLVGGLFRIVVALTHQFHHRVWVLVNGVITLLLGILIWVGWPESSAWLLGTFVGIELIFTGSSWVMLALAAHSVTGEAQPQGPR
jgi:uncharacterized membrane protein HdeD (DUF308 family)